MPTIRTRISIIGLTHREVEAGLPTLEQHLRSLPQIQNPITAWDDRTESLILILESTGPDPTTASQSLLGQLNEPVIRSFTASSGHLHFQIDEAKPLPS